MQHFFILFARHLQKYELLEVSLVRRRAKKRVTEAHLAGLKSIATKHSIPSDAVLVEVSHQRETVVVDRALIKAAIKLVESIIATLIHINDTTIDYSANARRALALQLNLGRRLSPVNEVSSAVGS